MAPDLDCSSPTTEMRGYLRKSKKWNKRFFVLREGPPPRLEYYDSEKKCGTKGKPKKTIDLDKAWNIDKKVSSKHKFLIGVYTEEEYFAMSADSPDTQEMWVNALQKAVLSAKGHNNRSHCMYKHIWQGTVDTKDLDNCNSNVRINLHGHHRCCLTDKTMVFIRLNNAGGSDLHANSHVEIPIASIRSCGHKDNLFFMEPGRSSGIGTGKLWMELDDSAIADNMHSTILRFMYLLGQDDGNRPRSYSSGSGSSRVSSRTRHYYNPPPSQVGMRPNVATTPDPPSTTAPVHVRNRCESFPTPQPNCIDDDARYRTSSEGDKTMQRPYPLHSLYRKGGSVSPHMRSRVWSWNKRPLHLQPPFHNRTYSLPGSCTGTSSSNSSMEHIHISSEYTSTSRQSPTASEGNHSSDEYSSSPLTDHAGHLQHYMSPHPYRTTTPSPPGIINSHFLNQLSSLDMDQVPQPPSMPPQSNPLSPPSTTVTPLSHEYVNTQPVHSRSQSLDDNLSCGTEASSLSTSPRTTSYLVNASASPDVGYIYSQSPSQSSSHSQCSDCNMLYIPPSQSSIVPDEEYTMMNHGSNYPHENYPPNPNSSSDYAPMAFNKNSSCNGTTTENKSGYVSMRPLTHSSPQDIGQSRRKSVNENHSTAGSYSPVSPLSRSPDKPAQNGRAVVNSCCARCKRPESCQGYPCQCATLTSSASHPPIPPVSCHGLKVEPRNDLSQDIGRQKSFSKSPRLGESPPVKYSDDYAMMNGVTRHPHECQHKPPHKPTRTDSRKSSTSETSSTSNMDNEYLPMNPMNMSNGRKTVVGAILSVAESSSRPTPQYPHQAGVSHVSSFSYSTNSLDRSAKHIHRRRTTSLIAPSRSSHKQKKSSRKASLKIRVDPKPSNGPSQPPLSPGGEYVAIDFDKASKQASSSSYVSLTTDSASGEPDFGSESNLNHRIMSTPKATHDSNSNLLSPKQSSPSDDYIPIKHGELDPVRT